MSMTLFCANGKMFNDVPSYRVGKEIRAHLKGSLSSPTSITRKGTSMRVTSIQIEIKDGPKEEFVLISNEGN